LVAALFLACQCVSAHDIPVDVTVQALVKPVDQNLHLIIRVPLKAMRDVEFPEQGPGYLDLDRIDTTLHEAATLWIAKQIEIYEGDVRLPDPRVFQPPSGAVRAFEFIGDPGLVRLDPSWHQAALRFVELGFFHILDGTDHLLFLFCLVIPFRRFRALIPVVTAFTVAHSITLIASAYNFAPNSLWFPPLIETLIAVSIVYMALENIVGVAKVQRRWMVAFGFGLVHGFGFSFALRQTLQFAGSHLLTSLLSFNVGVELGQILMLALFIPALELLFRYVVAERVGTIILSALVTHTAWHWMTERATVLSQYRFQWPVLNVGLFALAMRWMMVLVILAGMFWLLLGPLRDRIDRGTARKVWAALRPRRSPPIA
jgi:hypothetical protein